VFYNPDIRYLEVIALILFPKVFFWYLLDGVVIRCSKNEYLFLAMYDVYTMINING